MQAVLYTAGGLSYMRLRGARKNKPYTLKHLEKLAGFKLSPNAPDVLFKYGFIRVCKDCPGSYRVD